MVQVSDFDEWMAKSKSLFEADPVKTRYNYRFRADSGEAVIKVTNVCRRVGVLFWTFLKE